jgi:hypothetical protein
MLRFIILLVVAAAVLVFIRLLLLRASMRAAPPRSAAQSTIIQMPSVRSLTIKHYFFANFDPVQGPVDHNNFFENLIVHVGPEDSDRYRVYSMWVATPGATKPGPDGFRFGRGVLIVDRYDLGLVLRAVRQHIHELGLLAEEVN